MTTQTWITLVISFITDFIISAGGAIASAMVATGSAEVPGKGAIIFALVTGLVAASRRVQALLAPSVTRP